MFVLPKTTLGIAYFAEAVKDIVEVRQNCSARNFYDVVQRFATIVANTTVRVEKAG